MAKIFFLIAAIFAILIGGLKASTPVRKCNNGKPLPLMVQINDCHELTCDFIKGTQSNMAVQFVATKNSMSQIHAKVHLSTLGAQIPFDLEEPRSDVCKNLMYGAYCPLDAGEDVTYHLLMQVNDNQPEVLFKIEVNLLDQNDNSVVACFLTDGRVRRNKGVNKTEAFEYLLKKKI